MAETRTTKFSLPQWSSGTTDSPSREDFNEAFTNIETLALRAERGPIGQRRAPGLTDTYWIDDDGTIWRDTGTSWVAIGMPRNGIDIIKESGTNPAVRVEIPTGITADAISTVHSGKGRFRVSSSGDVVASSVRMYQSDVLPPANNLPTTLGVIPKSATASGIGVWGNTGQIGNLIEAKTASGATLSTLSSSGDHWNIGRGSFGSMDPAPSQLFVKGTQEARPVVLARSSNPLLGTGPVLVAENGDGTFQIAKVDSSGRAAFGYRASTSLLPIDLLALNMNTPKNASAAAITNGKFTFRNTTSGYGVAGIDVRQEAQDNADTASLGLFAGTAGVDGESPERVRFGITPEKIGARMSSSAPDWTPFVVKSVAGQVAALLTAQRADGTVVAAIAPTGRITAASFVGTDTAASSVGGDFTSSGKVNADAIRAFQQTLTDAAGIESRIQKNHTATPHFLAADETGKARARINNDGTLEVGMDTDVVPAGATLMKLRGQEYRQFGRKLQSFDPEAGRWGSFESAFAAEYYSLSAQNVRNAWVGIIWNGETNDNEAAYGWVNGSTKIQVPFTGWYDVRALAHCDMNFTGSGSATFRINNNIEMKFRRDYPRALGWDVVTLSLNDLVFLNAGDQLEFLIQIDSFLFTTRTKNTGDYRSRLSIRFAGNS